LAIACQTYRPKRAGPTQILSKLPFFNQVQPEAVVHLLGVLISPDVSIALGSTRGSSHKPKSLYVQIARSQFLTNGRRHYRTARGLDKSVMRSLTQQSGWVGPYENVFVLGPTDVGKSFVARALAQKACRDGYSALYTRAQSLFRDLAIARADGSLRSLLARLSRIDVHVIDDWAMAPLSEPERRDFWEICEDRYQIRSAILTSQLPVSRWHGRSEIPRWLTGFSIDWSTVHIASRSVEIRCARTSQRGTRNGEQPDVGSS
jgi:DNA replication protein DnaC